MTFDRACHLHFFATGRSTVIAAMFRLTCAFVILSLTAGGSAAAQGIGVYSKKHVAISGNSLAQFQGGFQSREFPLLPPANVVIRGQYSYTCAMILPLVTYLAPANSDVIVLLDSTNDIRTNVPVQQHMACIEQTIATLLLRNPAARIVVANTPPWTQWDPCTNQYRDHSIVDLIEAYNAAYADPASGLQAQWPANVRVADVFTPSADSDGWAIPQYMTGPCGIHPGDAGVWSASWQHFADGYTGLVMSSLNGQW